MTTKTKLIAFLNHYCQVLDTINLVNAGIIYLPYVNQITVRKDVEIYNNEEGKKEVEEIIKEISELLRDENINNQDFIFCRFHGHMVFKEKFNCQKHKKGCIGCPLCPFPPLDKLAQQLEETIQKAEIKK